MNPPVGDAPLPPVAPHVGTVVCSPHFDDAVLCCWSVLERIENCAVVNVFTGAPRLGFTAWFDQLNGAATSAELMGERAFEDRSALSMVGKTAIDLGMLEVQYRLRQSRWLHALFRRMHIVRFVLLRIPGLRRALVAVSPPSPEELANAIQQAVPGATDLCAPAGIGGHPDHLLVRQAAAVLASRGLNVRLYADMPYSMRYGWPRWIAPSQGLRRKDRANAYWARSLEPLGLDNMVDSATIVRLTPAERARKALAVQRYATQVELLNSGHTRAWVENGGLDCEVFWQLRSAAREAARYPVAQPRATGSPAR